jgi:hypothetical protein
MYLLMSLLRKPKAKPEIRGIALIQHLARQASTDRPDVPGYTPGMEMEILDRWLDSVVEV